MASDLQREKTSIVFAAMDVNGDGYLERADFEALTDRWVHLRDGYQPERLREIMMGWWEALHAASDQDSDEKVSHDEVLRMVDNLGTALDLVVATAESMFEAVDEDGDGAVSAPEYGRMIHAWTGDETPTDGVFALLDLDGDGTISKSEFVRHWVEFWAGDDPEAPGTHVFGEVPAGRQV
ncbi:EF-hand domain-containing protein [Saccharothrix longispora]|uniref:EF-hand domain-containing protein n=1 Tax=Saccharothrix longispora TaxID=33920 RepID=UPI0028FD94B2|nr:EF-hand domain-containing protein [Saccharothrix longispora]MBY8849914.1 EF-hand domain-containing protein [Saccharothrix sp. MB29]MDU0290119.1 EF-hand domain-containing protein [Saccharothrix longispora]